MGPRHQFIQVNNPKWNNLRHYASIYEWGEMSLRNLCLKSSYAHGNCSQSAFPLFMKWSYGDSHFEVHMCLESYSCTPTYLHFTWCYRKISFAIFKQVCLCLALCIWGPLDTRAESRDREIVRAQKKVSTSRPNTPPSNKSQHQYIPMIRLINTTNAPFPPDSS